MGNTGCVAGYLAIHEKKVQTRGEPSDALSQRAISLDQVRILQPLAGKASIASVDGYDRPVLCEWINYDLHTMDLGPASMFARVGAIVHNFAMEPLPADFNVLHCRGYFHDLAEAEARFGMLFDYPLSAQPTNITPRYAKGYDETATSPVSGMSVPPCAVPSQESTLLPPCQLASQEHILPQRLVLLGHPGGGSREHIS